MLIGASCQSASGREPIVNKQVLRCLRRLSRRHRLTGGTIREYYDPRSLLIDWDKPRAPSFRWLSRELYLLTLQPVAMYYARSASGQHWHVVVYLRDPLPIFVKLFVEVYLGSDRDRARHDFNRAYHLKRRDRLVTVLFERKLQHGR